MLLSQFVLLCYSFYLIYNLTTILWTKAYHNSVQIPNFNSQPIELNRSSLGRVTELKLGIWEGGVPPSYNPHEEHKYQNLTLNVIKFMFRTNYCAEEAVTAASKKLKIHIEVYQRQQRPKRIKNNKYEFTIQTASWIQI